MKEEGRGKMEEVLLPPCKEGRCKMEEGRCCCRLSDLTYFLYFFVSSLSSAVFNVLHLVTKILLVPRNHYEGRRKREEGRVFATAFVILRILKFPSILHYYLTSYTLILIS